MDIAAALAEVGIRLKSYTWGNHYCTCPECSHKRKGSNKNLKCLSVKIDERGCTWNCHNCGWVGARNVKSESFKGHREERDQPRSRNIYGALQRASLARWVRRAG